MKTSRAFLSFSAALLTSGAFACGGEPERPDATPTMSAAPAPVFMSVDELLDEEANEDLVLLHVNRDDEDFQAGHIPGAVYMPFSSIVEEVDGIANELPAPDQLASAFESVGVSDESLIVLTGWPLGAARAWVALEALGFNDQARILDGGVAAWQKVGGMLTTDVEDVTAGEMMTDPDRGAIVDADWVAQRLEAPGVRIVDARPEDQHTGETPGTGVERGGHLPGSIHMYWETLRDPDGVLLPQAQLEARFRAAGIQAGDTVVAYCRTGVQASYLYAAARELGHPVRLYDASYMDWSARTDLPVATGR